MITKRATIILLTFTTGFIMKSIERQQRILDYFRDRDHLDVKEIIDLLPSSPATIRRDLVAMERGGKIRKARGKIFREKPDRTPPVELRGLLRGDEKKAIARAAAALVNEGDSIIIDAGTTTQALAEQLRGFRNLSVVTNSIPVAVTLNNTAVRTFICGGTIHDMALLDDDAEAYFSLRRVNKAFLGATGVREEEGVSVVSSFQFAVKRKMMQSANEVYVLLDSSKFDCMGITIFADFSELTGLVTTRPIKNGRLLERLDKLGVKVIYAEEV
jgi:DeoR/GlpR family transcriptional regulator of sugar metabolism